MIYAEMCRWAAAVVVHGNGEECGRGARGSRGCHVDDLSEQRVCWGIFRDLLEEGCVIDYSAEKQTWSLGEREKT